MGQLSQRSCDFLCEELILLTTSRKPGVGGYCKSYA
jgi:hypothetical protein